MKFTETELPGVFVIEPKVFKDERGYFFESFNEKEFEENIGKINFVQDNESKSSFGVLRGLHYQLPPFTQSKLVRVIKGKILDVAVNIKKNSPTFGKYVMVELSENNKKQLFIPKGFAHGFIVLSDYVIFNYKVDNYYSKEHDRGVKFNDSEIGIEWPIRQKEILLSEKDKSQPLLKGIDKDELLE